MDIGTILSAVYTLSRPSLELFLDIVEKIELPKGYILLKEGKIEYDMYFISTGIVRAYSIREGNEVTFWFGEEGSVICSMKNYIEQKVSYESIELLSDCVLYKVDMNKLQQLYYTNIEIANWGRKFIEYEYMRIENRLIDLQISSASERYEALLKEHPTIIQRVPLNMVASYIGITQVSLSRIRAKR